MDEILESHEDLKKRKLTKSVMRKIRFTEQQAKELDNFLSEIDMNFSEFVREAVSLRQSVTKATKKKKVVVAPPPKVDRELLIQIGRIGTNINQIARSLNILKNDESQQELRNQFSFAECLIVLQQMQIDLNSVVGELPKIQRSEEAVTNAKKRALEKAFKSVADELETNDVH